jgi:hypothetical protein
VKMPTKEELQIDCFRLLAELAVKGVNNAEAARRLGVNREKVRGWKCGAKPKYDDAQRLVFLHAYVCKVGDKPDTDT